MSSPFRWGVEALIVFPPDAEADFPWPAQTLTDRFAGPFWNFVTGTPGHPAIAAAAELSSVDSLTLPAYPSLAAVISRTRLYSCELEAPVITCGRPLKGAVSVDNGCLLYTSPSPRDGLLSRMPSSA